MKIQLTQVADQIVANLESAPLLATLGRGHGAPSHREVRHELIRRRDQMVAAMRFRPANGVPAREGTGHGSAFISRAETEARSAAIARINTTIKVVEKAEIVARERHAAEMAAVLARKADPEWKAEQARRAADIAQKTRQGQKRAAVVVAHYRAATPAAGVRTDRRAQKAAVNGWDVLVGNYDK